MNKPNIKLISTIQIEFTSPGLVDYCPRQRVIRVKKNFIHENIIHSHNHGHFYVHTCKNIILHILNVHADGHTQTAGNGKKLARRIEKAKPKNKTTRSTLRLCSNTLICLHKLPFDFTFDKKSQWLLFNWWNWQCFLFMWCKMPFNHSSAFNTTDHLSRSYKCKFPSRVANYHPEFA